MHPWSMSKTIEEIMDRVGRNHFTQHCVVNVAKLIAMRGDRHLNTAVNACDIINIDGQGVVWGARLCGLDIPERVAGIDLFHQLLRASQKRGYPVFLLGAREEVVARATETLSQTYPGLVIAGSHHGYFWDDEASVVERIAGSRARLLFVAISSPRKETFINRWKNELGVDFVMGVGGTFDVVAGKTRRAPVWMQKVGLEWLYRLLQEPGRMWKRYFKTNIEFAYLLLRELLHNKGTIS